MCVFVGVLQVGISFLGLFFVLCECVNHIIVHHGFLGWIRSQGHVTTYND